MTDNGKNDHDRGIAPAPSGGWWVTGSSRAAGFASNYPGDAWAGKLGSDGKLQLLYNPAKGGIDDVLEGIVPLADGSAWALGWIDQTVDGTNLSDRDLWMVHLGADGKVLDDQAPKAAKWQMLSKGHLSKNGWIFSGSKDEKAWVGERDATGKILWDVSMGHANAAFTVATDVTQTADGSLFAPVYGGGLNGYGEGFLLHVAPDKKATLTPYINSSYMGAPGTILAQPDGSALLVRAIWNGSKWELSIFRRTGPNLIQPLVTVGIFGNQYAFDAIQLAPGGDLFIAGIGTREWGIDNGAEVWRVSLQGKVVWSEAPQVSATTHSGYWGLAAGPQPNTLTAVGFASKTGAKQSDAWARSMDASGKIFCNGSPP